MTRWRIAAWTLPIVAFLTPSVVGALKVTLEVDLPSGTASAVFTDDDADGVIDFDTTVGSAFFARGQVKQDLNPIIQELAIAPTGADTNAIFRNVDSVSRTFRVIVTSDDFPSIAPSLGWNL